jgi:hypothetical protein
MSTSGASSIQQVSAVTPPILNTTLPARLREEVTQFFIFNENVRIQKPINIAVADRNININTCASRLSSAESPFFFAVADR